MLGPTERFAALVHAGGEPPLDEAALLIAAHAHPGLDVAGYRRRLDDIAATCPGPTIDALVDHLFGTLGFRGDADEYGDPRNSFLDEVLDRRLGIPITLSVVTLEVGRRLGVPIVGIGLPGHFVVRYEGESSVLIDPFNGGRVIEADECEAIVRRIYGPTLEFEAGMLAAVSNRAILARMLGNLKQAYQRVGDATSLEWVLRLRTALPDVGPHELGDLANTQAALGRYEDAADTLEDLAGQLPEPTAEQVAARAVQLRARLN